MCIVVVVVFCFCTQVFGDVFFAHKKGGDKKIEGRTIFFSFLNCFGGVKDFFVIDSPSFY